MSSDVYMYFCPKQRPFSPDETGQYGHHYCDKCERIGLGDLGVMCYFGFNVLTILGDIQHKTISPEWLAEAVAAARLFEASKAIDREMDPTLFAKYGYIGPHGIDWDTGPSESRMQDIAQEYAGCFWDISWD